MLGFFPRMYPNELLYSWLARYHMYSMNSGYKRTMIELFDNPHHIAVPDLPVNLERLQKKVKHFFEFTTDDLILNYTFFRFYTAFATPEIRDRTLSHMRHDAREGAVHMETGVMASTFKEKEFFHYCVLCAEEDLQAFGEMYWHLHHQLPGVLVCTKHQILLSKSIVLFRTEKRHNYVAASRETCPILEPITSYDPKTMEHLLGIALEAERLSQRNVMFNRKALRQTYLVQLQKRGLARGMSHVNQIKLAEQFRAFYGDECLQLLQSAILMEEESSWLKEITRKHRKAFHPIRHLLLIRFLGETLDSINSKIHTPYNPFGKAPYPCLNQAADHFRKLVISDINISRCTDTGKPVGTFTCACGFQYSRKGPDLTEADRFRLGRIKAFGPVWKSRLDELIHVEKLSFRATARELGVDTKTVIKYSKKAIPSAICEPVKQIDSVMILEIKQRSWNDLRTHYPEACTTQLRKEDSALYSWLYRNCRDWLAENSPTQSGGQQSKARIDWGTRDLCLVQEVKKAAQKLLQINPPVRLTPSRIARTVRKRALIEKHLDKLPETKKALTQLNESKDIFHIRRIRWATEEIRKAGLNPVEWLVIKMAAIRLPLSSRVEKEIQNIMANSAFSGRSIV